MLNVPVPFPHVGSTAYFDDIGPDGKDVVEKVRILRVDGDANALISIRSRRYPHEIASGNRTVPLASLREHEQANPVGQLLGHTDDCPHFETKFPWKCNCQKKAAAKRARLEKSAQPSGRTQGSRR